MALRPLALALALALTAAGCMVKEDDPVDAASITSADADGEAPESIDAAPEGAAGAAPAEPVLVTVPLSFKGKTGTRTCLPSGPNGCSSPPVAPPSGGSGWYAPELGGIPQSLTATLTWEAATPATDTLTFYVLAVTSCGEGCWEGETVADAEGKSPLALDVAALEVPDGASLAFGVHPPCKGAGPVFSCVSLDQEYEIAGSAVVARS